MKNKNTRGTLTYRLRRRLDQKPLPLCYGDTGSVILFTVPL